MASLNVTVVEGSELVNGSGGSCRARRIGRVPDGKEMGSNKRERKAEKSRQQWEQLPLAPHMGSLKFHDGSICLVALVKHTVRILATIFVRGVSEEKK